jgi:hypothetical protein
MRMSTIHISYPPHHLTADQQVGAVITRNRQSTAWASRYVYYFFPFLLFTYLQPTGTTPRNEEVFPLIGNLLIASKSYWNYLTRQSSPALTTMGTTFPLAVSCPNVQRVATSTPPLTTNTTASLTAILHYETRLSRYTYYVSFLFLFMCPFLQVRKRGGCSFSYHGITVLTRPGPPFSSGRNSDATSGDILLCHFFR